jgi:tetratricopeptide (TPR) repeat protein
MPSPSSLADSGLATELLDCVKAFEEAWEAGRTPRIEDYLPAEGPARLPHLAALVQVTLERRIQAGQCARVEEYLERFPELHSDQTVIQELARAEYRCRQQREGHVSPVEYAQRFPQFEANLTGLFAQPSAPTTLDESDSKRPGAPPPPPTGAIAGHEILKELGHGGMGVVYLARQLGLNRLVAIKMIRDSALARPEERVRFLAEAEAVAQLHHPHIVQIHAIGQAQQPGGGSAVPYFSLEYVSGGTLAQKLAGTPLPARDGALLLETIARAAHFAHEHGIVHRDLKPSNVLLTPEGLSKLSDFGLAKRVEGGPDLTQSGAPVGTPSYMAPEQCGRHGRVAGVSTAITRRTDVYALGAILYEMLTGRPPFKAATSIDTLLQVVSEEPVAVTRLQPKTPPDLETICHKCLQKDPTKRYETADSLAEDLHRFLNGEPILARPVGRLERSWRWCRRNPGVAGLAAAVAVLLVGVAVAATIAAAVFRGQNARLEKANQDERVARAIADQNFTEALEAVKTQVVQIDSQLRNRPGTRQLRENLLQDGIERLERLVQNAGQRADAHRTAALAHKNLGDVLRRLALQPARAREHYQLALESTLLLAASNPDDLQIQRELAACYERLGTVALQMVQTEQALELYNRSHEIFTKLDAPALSSTRSRGDLCLSHQRLGDAYLDRNSLPEALQHLTEAHAIAVQLVKTGSGDSVPWETLSITHNKLGDVHQRSGDLATALKHFAEEVKISETRARAATNFRAQYDLSISYQRMGNVCQSMRDLSSAKSWFEKMHQVASRVAAQDRYDIQTQLAHASALGHLAEVSRFMGQGQEALKYSRESLQVRRELARIDESDAEVQFHLFVGQWEHAQVQAGFRRFGAARKTFEEAARVIAALDKQNRLKAHQKRFVREVQAHVVACALCDLGDVGDVPSWPLLWGWPRF